MEQFQEKLYHAATLFVQILAFIFTLSLFFVNFIWTCYSTDMTSQLVLTTTDSPLRNTLLTLLSILLLSYFTHLFQKNAVFWKKLLLILTPCTVILLGMLLLLFSKSVPAADAMSVYDCAQQIASGNLACIHPTDSYLSYYPQQIGLLALYETVIRILKLLPFSVRYYHLLKIGYIFLVCGIIFCLYKITDRLWKSPAADCLCLLLCGLNAPLIMYSSFLYSEIPSFFAASFGFYHLICLLQNEGKGEIRRAIAAILGLSVAVLLRKNSLIFIIAAVLILLFEWLRQKKKILLFTCLGVLICSMAILPCVIKIYELRADSRLSSGVPAISYFAMGMQEGGRAAGWYNGFNFNTYQNTGMDKDKTTRLSKLSIKERTLYFRTHPGECFSFYWEKFLSQWADGTFASRQATLATFGGRSAFFQELYEGKYSPAFISYCNIYYLLICLGALLFTVNSLFFREKKPKCTPTLYPYLLMTGVFGGFLFHMLWEANSRYIFLYGLCLLPYAFKGFSDLGFSLSKFVPRMPRKEKQQAEGTDSAAAPQDQGTE